MFEFGVGYSELFVLAIIAVIVIGPKDLPVVLRKFGQIMQRVRGMAKEFQGHVDVAMKDAGMGDLKKDLNEMKSAVNGSMSSTPDKTLSPKPTATDFNKFFGDAPFEGETRVAGSAAQQSSAQQA
jgi:sec-independent protein translocase protein TatB